MIHSKRFSEAEQVTPGISHALKSYMPTRALITCHTATSGMGGMYWRCQRPSDLGLPVGYRERVAKSRTLINLLLYKYDPCEKMGTVCYTD